jgi:hypothetical protein
MGSIVNPVLAMSTSPNWMSLLPGRNPSGAGGTANGLPATGSSSGVNPLLGNPNVSPNAPSANPYDTSVVPSFGANTGSGYSPTSLLPAPGGTPPTTTVGAASQSPIGGFNLMTSKDLGRMYNDLKKTYGDGVAHAILDFLSSGAGFNQDAINNLFAALGPGIERGTESLMNQFSTSGNRFGSGAQIGLADYLSQVQLNEGQLETQMYESSINDFMNVLMGVGGTNAQRKAASPTAMDTLSGLLPIISGGAGAASAAGVGGTAGSILDVIAGMG